MSDNIKQSHVEFSNSVKNYLPEQYTILEDYGMRENKQGWYSNSDSNECYPDIRVYHHYVDNILDNDNGPANIEMYYGDQNIIFCVRWYKNGKLHRLDGPAYQDLHETQTYYLNGKNLSRKQYFNHPLVIEKTIDFILDD